MVKRPTREMIRDQFVRMLNEQPLDKITVTELVERCQINRKTFYYYYQDLYAIVDEIFAEELSRVLREGGEKSWEKNFLAATRFARENRRAVNHVYHSVSRETLEQYLYKISGQVLEHYVDEVNRDIGANDYDKKLITVFYQSVLTALAIRWVASGMKDSPERSIMRMGQLFEGSVAETLKRSLERPEQSNE